jgi:hypothetical protein
MYREIIMVSGENRGRMDNGADAGRAHRKAYVKPVLETHGSVQQLTQSTHKGSDCGSNMHYRPGPIGGKFFDL